MPVDNEGSVSTSAGTLKFVEGGASTEHAVGSWSTTGTETAIVFNTSSETYNLGATTTFSGNFEVDGTTVKAGKIEAAAATVTLNGGTSFGVGGILELAGGSTSNIKNLTLAAPHGTGEGVLKVAGEVDVSSSFTSSSGTLHGSGTVVVESGATGKVEGHGLFLLGGVTFKTAAALTVSGADGSAIIQGEENSVVVNSGTLVLNTEGYSLRGNAGTKFVNKGTFKD